METVRMILARESPTQYLIFFWRVLGIEILVKVSLHEFKGINMRIDDF
jgi:hypothetical protein